VLHTRKPLPICTKKHAPRPCAGRRCAHREPYSTARKCGARGTIFVHMIASRNLYFQDLGLPVLLRQAVCQSAQSAFVFVSDSHSNPAKSSLSRYTFSRISGARKCTTKPCAGTVCQSRETVCHNRVPVQRHTLCYYRPPLQTVCRSVALPLPICTKKRAPRPCAGMRILYRDSYRTARKCGARGTIFVHMIASRSLYFQDLGLPVLLRQTVCQSAQSAFAIVSNSYSNPAKSSLSRYTFSRISGARKCTTQPCAGTVCQFRKTMWHNRVPILCSILRTQRGVPS
jgi:hypothetical protein